jgi:hypothetical protein
LLVLSRGLSFLVTCELSCDSSRFLIAF